MIYLSLGSNLGDRAENLRVARELLAEALQAQPVCSAVLETEAIGFNGPAFLNQVVGFESDIAPEALLDRCQEIEEKLGRPRHAAAYDPATGRRLYSNRIIDIDILIYNDLEYHTDRLTLPHPQVQSRPFVRTLLDNIKQRNNL